MKTFTLTKRFATTILFVLLAVSNLTGCAMIGGEPAQELEWDRDQADQEYIASAKNLDTYQIKPLHKDAYVMIVGLGQNKKTDSFGNPSGTRPRNELYIFNTYNETSTFIAELGDKVNDAKQTAKISPDRRWIAFTANCGDDTPQPTVPTECIWLSSVDGKYIRKVGGPTTLKGTRKNDKINIKIRSWFPNNDGVVLQVYGTVYDNNLKATHVSQVTAYRFEASETQSLSPKGCKWTDLIGQNKSDLFLQVTDCSKQEQNGFYKVPASDPQFYKLSADKDIIDAAVAADGRTFYIAHDDNKYVTISKFENGSFKPVFHFNKDEGKRALTSFTLSTDGKDLMITAYEKEHDKSLFIRANIKVEEDVRRYRFPGHLVHIR
ncbi:MAG TPA: hypothetical protein DCE42_03715 [Myxococcales bacterium]|nr:hypothetical protein [Deltaproteobacteria bacterium]HAA53832.1 hypothetical protein [Myxococcales bacterium]|tara:strand:- start:9391 stop:10524 length:1134 start_codon:yes stop_codon:yes gene_type:complete